MFLGHREDTTDGPESITLTCDDCKQPYETDPDDARNPWHRCHDCREKYFYEREEKRLAADATYQRAVRNFDKRSA